MANCSLSLSLCLFFNRRANRRISIGFFPSSLVASFFDFKFTYFSLLSSLLRSRWDRPTDWLIIIIIIIGWMDGGLRMPPPSCLLLACFSQSRQSKRKHVLRTRVEELLLLLLLLLLLPTSTICTYI